VTPTEHGWTFNENEECPTFAPSILFFPHPSSPPFAHQVRCHSFIRDGRWEFLSDCEHALAGQTVDMVDVFGDNP